MKTKLTALGLLFSSLAFSQVTVDGNLFINTGATFYSDMAININTTTGSLNVEGNLEVTGDITGDEKVVLAETASLDLDAGTLTLNETNEKFTDLTLGTTGIVEVSAGKSLTLTGDLDNQNTSDGLTLLADASGYAQLLTTGTISTKGGTHAEQYLTASANEGWRQFGSPVTATFAQVDDDFQTYYPNSPGTVGTSEKWNLKYWDASSTTATPTDPAKGWTEVYNNAVSFGPANNAIGYSIFVGSYFNVLNNGILDLEGEVGNGDYTYQTQPTSANGLAAAINKGWQLIPNPYPSNINISDLLGNTSDFPLAYKAIHIWNGKSQQYTAVADNVYTDFSGTTTPDNNTVNIAPFQAFWVKGSETVTETVTLKNSHRTLVAQGNYFKTTPDLIRLNATAADGAIDQTIITFEQDADDNLDGRDAFKIMSLNEDMHNMYTFADGNKIAINRKAIPAPDKHIPMYFEAPNANVFKIDMVQETVAINWAIELEDHKTGAIHNLRNGEYSFKNDPSFTSNRFTVHINKTGRSVALNNAERVNIYGNDEGINVSFLSTKSQIADVSIYNVAGQTLFTGRINTDETFVWPVHGIPAMYVVNVKLLTETFTEKVVR